MRAQERAALVVSDCGVQERLDVEPSEPDGDVVRAAPGMRRRPVAADDFIDEGLPDDEHVPLDAVRGIPRVTCHGSLPGIDDGLQLSRLPSDRECSLGVGETESCGDEPIEIHAPAADQFDREGPGVGVAEDAAQPDLAVLQERHGQFEVVVSETHENDATGGAHGTDAGPDRAGRSGGVDEGVDLQSLDRFGERVDARGWRLT